jgi:hypothetical protein
MMFGLSVPATIAIAIAAALLIAGGAAWTIYGKGESAGSAKVTTAVQGKTIQTLDAARISKERTDEEVRRTPYDDRADSLR